MLAPWFAGYGLVGMVVSGIVPILLPLSVEPKGPFVVGLVVAAFYLGTLIAPAFGSLADKTGTQRLTFLMSFPAMAVSAIVFGLADNAVIWFGCMLVAGAAAGAAQTTASMFIVEGQPREEWDERIGWIRLAFGSGQVIGLAVAAVFAHHLDAGWFVAGGLVAAGAVLGSWRLPVIEPAPPTATDTSSDAPKPGRLQLLMAVLRSEFGVFLGCWLFAMIGLMTFYNVVPLVLRDGFGIDPSTTSTIFLAGSAVGAILYPVCGSLTRRLGPATILAAGIAVTLFAFVVMSVTGVLKLYGGAAVAGGCLVVIAAAYPFQYVGATILAAQLATGGEGSAMGLFNSGVAAGAVVGAMVPSFLANAAGYESLPIFSAASLVVAVAFGIPILTRSRSRSATRSAAA